VDRLLLALAAGALGALIVGPFLSYAVLQWIGRRGVLPLLLGWEPDRAELGGPHPACRTCGESLTRRRLPVLPWLAVGGRCRSCREGVGRWVLGVEAVTGVAFGVGVARVGWSAELMPMMVLIAGLVAASAVDLRCSRIPTQFVYLTDVGVAVAIGIAVLVDGGPSSLVGAVVGGAVYLGVLGAMWLVAGGGMGFGDVRLGMPIGLVAGWVGWESDHPVAGPLGGALLGLLVASLVAGLIGLVLLVVRRRSRPYPFGPWLSLGGLVAILAVA
jgi:leader peptidase (prepilin peptidase)/N-methyltransferase